MHENVFIEKRLYLTNSNRNFLAAGIYYKYVLS